MLQLRFSVDGENKVVPLAGPEIRFGRSGDNEVVLPDYSVSRRHAALRREGDYWVVYDLESTNGVQVNRIAVEQSKIQAQDRLKIGVFEILIERQTVRHDQRSATAVATEMPADVQEQVRSLAGERQAQAGTPVPRPTAATGTDPSLGAADRAPRGSAAPALSVPPAASPRSSLLKGDSAISNATIIRPLSDFSAEFGFEGFGREGFGTESDGSGGDGPEGGGPEGHSSAVRKSKRQALDEAYNSHIFGFMTRLARLLISTDSDDEILKHVLAIAFEALPVDRGFILLRDEETGELECELVRLNEHVELRPESEVPISKTMLESVIQERVALLTYDALSDQRLAGTESVRIHQIRAAMCAPLWSGEKIVGVMQVDTPHHTGSFTEPDVDLLAALANYCAVAIVRNRNAREAEFQRQMRSRLERYHSPAVVEAFMQRGAAVGDEARHSLMQTEVSVLFADFVGFTAYSEKAPPEEVAALMESYFTHAVEAIFTNGGTLDKFIGDCVMAFFGAPVSQPDHAYRAVNAAICFCDALDRWNAERRERGLSPVATRVGINSGPVVVGDIGSKRRVDYTVLGNTVNVAARLEGNVAGPGDIVLGDATHRLLAGKIVTNSLGEFQLKGLSQGVIAHRVVRF